MLYKILKISITHFMLYNFKSIYDIKINLSVNKNFGRLRLKCDDTRAETRFLLLGETDEHI